MLYQQSGRFKSLGKNQHAEFRKTRNFAYTIQLDNPIKKTKVIFLKVSATKGQSTKSMSKELKIHIRLFSQIYISTQIREETLKRFTIII